MRFVTVKGFCRGVGLGCTSVEASQSSRRDKLRIQRMSQKVPYEAPKLRLLGLVHAFDADAEQELEPERRLGPPGAPITNTF